MHLTRAAPAGLTAGEADVVYRIQGFQIPVLPVAFPGPDHPDFSGMSASRPLPSPMKTTGLRGSFFDFVDDPWKHPGNEPAAARFLPDGLLVVRDGIIAGFGTYEEMAPRFPGIRIESKPGRLMLPGFIDGHVHFPQTRIMGAYGEHLLPWLQKWVFPEESKYRDPAYAAEGARHFFNNLLASGTTTCQAFTTSSPVSTRAFFEEASKRRMRVIAGLTGIDELAPDYCRDTAANFHRDSSALIAEYHGAGRSLYAITPRFALGASPALLQACQRLKADHPDCWVNTHLSESMEECRGVLAKFPDCADYLAVYEKYQLTGPKFTGGHGLELSDDEFRRLALSGSAVSFCPCSNLFLGNGFFRLGQATDPEARVRLSIGSDVGAGNRFCLLPTLDEAYKVGMCYKTLLEEGTRSGPDGSAGSPEIRASLEAQAARSLLSPFRAFYMLTLGGAESLYLDHLIGNFTPGKEADLVVLDWNAGQPAMGWHQSLLLENTSHGTPETITQAADVLFALMTLGDDRNIAETWIMGEPAFVRNSPAVSS